jgi:Tol biopolymer transport system component/DNA-binding CsgD family transcriptional regulator
MTTRRRGRPPHPDILTPREWEVLELIEQGLTNEQIGEELSISSDGAKFHVAQILGKLGVSSRHEAPSVAYTHRGQQLVRRWGFFPFLGKLGAGKTVNTIAAGGVVAASIVALVVLFFALRGQAGEPFDMYPGLYVLDVDSGKVQRKVDLRGAQTEHFEWSKDGESFIVQRRDVQSDLQKLQVYDAHTGVLLAEDSLGLASSRFEKLRDGRIGLVYSRREDAASGEQFGLPAYAAVLDSVSVTVIEQVALGLPVHQAAWAPDGGSVAITSDSAPGVERQVRLGGGGPDLPARFVSWSPDGSLYAVALALQDQRRVEIWQSSTDTLLRVLDLAFPYADRVLYWSPDSRWLAATSEDQLMVAPVDGSSPPRVLVKGLPFSPMVASSLAWPSWSPDSASIAYVSAEGELWQVNVHNGALTELYATEMPIPTEPRWSPDGKQIAFRVGHHPGIFAVEADGSNQQYIVIGREPDLSPDGKRLSFAYSGNHYTITSKGRRLQAITSYPWEGSVTTIPDNWRQWFCPGGPVAPPHGSPERPPIWSPDGSEVAIVNADSDLVRRSVRSPGAEESIAEKASAFTWSPDGSQAVYIDFVSQSECRVVLLDAGSNELATVPGFRYEWLGSNALSVTELQDPFLSSPAAPQAPRFVVQLVGLDGQLIRRYEGAATISPSLDHAVVGTASNLLTDVIEVNSGRIIRTFATPAIGATFSPDGRYVFVRFHLLGAELIEVASGKTVRIVKDGSRAWFSPDSKSLAYSTFVCCESSLYLVDVSDPAAAPALLQTARDIREAAWSPESTHLAFTLIAAENSSLKGLVIAERSTRNQVAVTDNASHLQWFPDGKRLLYQGDVDP